MTDESAETPLLGNKLFCDEDFPASNLSLYENGDGVTMQWKRPYELSQNPQMFVDGASRADVLQGNLGDCWFLSACAAVAQGRHVKMRYDQGPLGAWALTSLIDDECPELINEVVPSGQVLYGDGYTGKVSFRFWRMGQWETVNIDDRLPVDSEGKLVYAYCNDPNEFWLPLMEKAFAKFHGNYHLLDGGFLDEGILSLTGALVKTIDFTDTSFFRFIRDEFHSGSIVLCASRQHVDEQRKVVPLHAYTITGLASFLQGEERVRLLRVRNPWGNQEWTGAWSDTDANWRNVDQAISTLLLETRNAQDGEAWMSLADFVENYFEVTVAKIIPDPDGLKLCASIGSWKKHLYGGGSPKNLKSFAQNPQFLLTVNEPDEVALKFDEDADDTESNETSTVRIELIQEHNRSKYRVLYPTGLAIYKATNPQTRLTAEELTEEVGSVQMSDNSTLLRRETLKPGYYVIVPFLPQTNLSRGFLLRANSSKPIRLEELHGTQEEPQWQYFLRCGCCCKKSNDEIV